MSSTSLTLKDCIDSLLKENETDRKLVKSILVDMYLIDAWNKQKINLSSIEEIEKQVVFFDKVAESISVISYDATTSFISFLEYFKKYSNLYNDFLEEIISEENAPWLSEIFKKKKLFFLVSDTQWKHRSVEVQAKFDFVLIGMDRCPTIEINIL